MSKAKCKWSIKRPLRVAMLITCSVGFFYQSLTLVLIFFSGRTIVEIRYEQQHRSHLPALTFRQWPYFSVKNLVEQYPQYSEVVSNYRTNNNSHQLIVDYLENQTLSSDQMERISWNKLNVSSFHLEAIDDKPVNFYETPLQLLSVCYPAKCSTLLLYLDPFYHSLRPKVIKIIVILTTDIDTLDNSSPFKFHLAFHSANNLPNHEHESFRVVKPGQMNLVRYSEIHTRLLPPPYQTNCKNYDYPYMRSDCIGKCLVRELARECGGQCVALDGINILLRKFALESVWHIPICTQSKFKDQYVCAKLNNDLLRDHCDKECRPDCHQIYYKYDIEYIDRPEAECHSVARNEICIKVKHYNWGDQVVQHRPIMSLIELMSDLGGLMGMWLGLSVVCIFDHVMNIF